MSAESVWVATAVGTAVGMLGWVVGLGKVLWPEHPQWALFFVIVIVTIVSMVIFERKDRRSASSAQS